MATIVVIDTEEAAGITAWHSECLFMSLTVRVHVIIIVII